MLLSQAVTFSVLRQLRGLPQRAPLHFSAVANAKRWKKKAELPFQSELTNPVDQVFGSEEELENGYIYDKKPFKVSVKKYHLYKWCGCGLSHQVGQSKSCRV